MTRLLFPALTLLAATPVLAHEGLHHHPHGIELRWTLAVALGVALGGALCWALSRSGWRK